jgi:hypothetical protein
VYTWTGAASQDWNNPANWKPADSAFPGSVDDTARFDQTAAANCNLTVSVQIKSLQCLAGFSKTLDLQNRILRIIGDADFSNGTIVSRKAKIVLCGTGDAIQAFRPNSRTELAAIQKEGTGTVRVISPLKVRSLAVRSGTWEWETGPDTVTGGISVRGSANMVFKSGVMLTIAEGNADFQGIGKLTLGSGNTLRFSGASPQVFAPRKGVLFPVIEKTGKGELTLAANPLSCEGLILSRGTWNWAAIGPDTVSWILSVGNAATMVLAGSTVCIRELDVDFRELATLDAKTGALDFIGSKTQYFASKPTLPEPTIRHSGTGPLRFGPRPSKSAERNDMGETSGIYAASDELAIREKMVSTELGLNFYSSSPLILNQRDTCAGTGFMIGLLIPIRIPNILVWYRAQAMFHGATVNGEKTWVYATAVNELLLGKAFLIKGLPFEIAPVAGGGIANGLSIGVKSGGGGMMINNLHPYLFLDAGLMIRGRYQMGSIPFSQGILLSSQFEFLGFEDSSFRFGVSLVTGY